MRHGRWFYGAAIAVLFLGASDRGVLASHPLLSLDMPSATDDRARDHGDEAGDDERTPYVAGIVGASFASDADGASGRLPMGDAAIGVSVPRPAGAVRLELEGRQRTALSGTRVADDTDREGSQQAIEGEWTTLANVWRDVSVGDHAAVYAGVGVGVGGFRETSATGEGNPRGRVTDFAWQAGGGATYAVTDRVTLDAGYRVYGVGADRDVEPAGEVVFAVRIADPFRSWLRR